MCVGTCGVDLEWESGGRGLLVSIDKLGLCCGVVGCGMSEAGTGV